MSEESRRLLTWARCAPSDNVRSRHFRRLLQLIQASRVPLPLGLGVPGPRQAGVAVCWPVAGGVGWWCSAICAGLVQSVLFDSRPLPSIWSTALDHRCCCAWVKVCSLQRSLLSKHMGIKLRLELFNASITPIFVYGLDTCALNQQQLNQQQLDNAPSHGRVGIR